jgi:hypothetical protein
MEVTFAGVLFAFFAGAAADAVSSVAAFALTLFDLAGALVFFTISAIANLLEGFGLKLEASSIGYGKVIQTPNIKWLTDTQLCNKFGFTEAP